MTFLFLICTASTLIYTICTVRELYQKQEITGFFIASAMYDLVFGILPMAIAAQLLWDGNEIRFLQGMLDVTSDGIYALIYYYVLSFLGFSVFYLSYHSKINIHVKSIINQFSVNFKRSNSAQNFLILSWLSLFIGVVSLYLWSSAYGSIFNLILEANAVRSGTGSITNSLAFFKHPARLVLICNFLFFSYLFKNKSSKKHLFHKLCGSIGLIITFSCSILFLLANDGRLTIVLYILAILWLYTAGKKFHHIQYTIFGGIGLICMSLFLINEMDSITHFIRFAEWVDNGKSITSSMIYELSFLPMGAQTSILSDWNDEVGLTFFDDLITGSCAWLPSSLKPTGYEDVWNINTRLIWGDLSLSHGQYPCSFITQAYYDLRVVGIILYCWGAGKVLRRIDQWSFSDTSLLTMSLKAVIMEFILRGVAYFSFYDIMLGIFPIVIVVILNTILQLLFPKKNSNVEI
jgi:hypothetical protein